jgi:hypothetical protein
LALKKPNDGRVTLITIDHRRTFLVVSDHADVTYRGTHVADSIAFGPICSHTDDLLVPCRRLTVVPRVHSECESRTFRTSVANQVYGAD